LAVKIRRLSSNLQLSLTVAQRAIRSEESVGITKGKFDKLIIIATNITSGKMTPTLPNVESTLSVATFSMDVTP